MSRETVFYLDILGFGPMAAGGKRAATDALTDLSEALRFPDVLRKTRAWPHRYALSDSVFLTHQNPTKALRQAGDLMFNLVSLNADRQDPVLIRGALAYGEVTHLKAVFAEKNDRRNVVGPAVVEAVGLAEEAGMKGWSRLSPAPIPSWSCGSFARRPRRGSGRSCGHSRPAHRILLHMKPLSTGSADWRSGCYGLREGIPHMERTTASLRCSRPGPWNGRTGFGRSGKCI